MVRVLDAKSDCSRQGEAEVCILNFKTTLSEFQITSQIAPAEAKPRCVFRVSSPPPSWSKAVVCVSTPRMYPRSEYFLVSNYFTFHFVDHLKYFYFTLFKNLKQTEWIRNFSDYKLWIESYWFSISPRGRTAKNISETTIQSNSQRQLVYQNKVTVCINYKTQKYCVRCCSSKKRMYKKHIFRPFLISVMRFHFNIDKRRCS